MESEILQFNLVLASDGTVKEYSPLASRVARQILGDEELSPGGMIVVSTDVNAKAGKGWVGWAKKYVQTWRNRLLKVKIVDEELSNEMKEKGMESGWSVGNLFRGRFYSTKTGKTFNEKSFCIDIRGVPFDFVKDAARKLGKEFNQESVLVVDHSNGRTFIIDSAK